MTRTFHVTRPQELEKTAREVLAAGDWRIFAFSGDLGAGKTTMIKHFCQQLRVEDTVQSPTFSIVNEYKTSSGASVFHMDFYRIRKTEEVFDLGYEDYLFSGNYCFIEWPEIIEELLPKDVVKIRLDIEGENSRKITVQFPDNTE